MKERYARMPSTYWFWIRWQSATRISASAAHFAYELDYAVDVLARLHAM